MTNQTPTPPEPSPFQLGFKEGGRFGCSQNRNPWKDETEEGQAWNDGYKAADDQANARAQALLHMGWSCGVLHRDNPSGWGHVMGHLVVTNGQAMACVFLGAEMRHQGKPLPTQLTPRECYELAAAGAQAQPLPERFKHNPDATWVHETAARIRDYFVQEDPVADHPTAKSYGVNLDALMNRIIYGDTPPPEQPTIVQATPAEIAKLASK